MSKSTYMFLSKLFFFGGLVSVVLSIGSWFFQGGMGDDMMIRASAERLGIFVGLWAPTMLVLSICLRHMAKDTE